MRLIEQTRRLLARIWIRLLAFNVLLVFLPAAGLLYLNTYERQLLAAQEREMVQQGRLFAAALAATETIDAWYSERVLLRLHNRSQARMRVIGEDGALIADSSHLGPKREPGEVVTKSAPSEPRASLLYRLGALPFRLYRGVFERSEGYESGDFYADNEFVQGAEVRAALAGRYGAATRITPGRQSVTLYTAIPIRWAGEVLGVVLVSQSTRGILAMLDAVRLDIFRVVLASIAVAALLSLYLAATFARPLSRLRGEALQIVDERGRLKRGFGGSDRRDEIGDLSRALEQLTARLQRHVDFTESFASDVSHEFKNPLASIRSATELLADVQDPADRERMISIVVREVARMERLLSGVRDVTRADADVEHDRAEVDLGQLVRGVIESARMRDATRRIEFSGLDEKLFVQGSSERLTQVVNNLLDNALSFSPKEEAVVVDLRVDGNDIVLAIADSGPGIPPEHRERVFDRFFTFRPSSPNGKGHVGLGLPIAQAIARGHGGDVAVCADTRDGARLELRLPAVDCPRA